MPEWKRADKVHHGRPGLRRVGWARWERPGDAVEGLSRGEMEPYKSRKSLPQPELLKLWVSENQGAKRQRGPLAPADHLLTHLMMGSSLAHKEPFFTL